MYRGSAAAYGGTVTHRGRSRGIVMRRLCITMAIVLVASGCAARGNTPASAPAPTTDQTTATATEAPATATATPPSSSAVPAGILAIIPTGTGPNELAATADAV